MRDYVNRTPEIRAAFNTNPYISPNALARAARDDEWAQVWGPARAAIQRARRIAGEGPGWIDRLEAALKAGVPLPVLAAAGVPVGALQLATEPDASLREALPASR
jgi:hypothetical protein